MRKFFAKQTAAEQGFTLMEIVVATAIFVTVVTGILVLFNYVLQINRRVQAVRQVSQASRNFTEVLSREIRNGRIDYQSSLGYCSGEDYTSQGNQHLAITTASGVSSCLYLDPNDYGILKVDRRSLAGTETTEVMNPPNFIVNPTNFQFIVRPTANPLTEVGIQPMVTILAEFIIFQGTRDEQIIPYQTTISSDIYDASIPPAL
jgi:prepilin-type N-terminal cleavage/methylation domain-containing protein